MSLFLLEGVPNITMALQKFLRTYVLSDPEHRQDEWSMLRLNTLLENTFSSASWKKERPARSEYLIAAEMLMGKDRALVLSFLSTPDIVVAVRRHMEESKRSQSI